MHKTRSNTETGLLFGIRPLLEAVEAGREVDKIYLQKNLKGQLFTELWEVIKTHHLPYAVVPRSRLDKFTRSNHQGVVTQLSTVRFQNLNDIVQQAYEKGQDPFIVLLDRVSDVRNFGAIARTAEGAGAHAIVITQKNSAAVNEDAMKTSAGALNHLPVCRETNLNQTLENLHQQGIKIVACTEKAETLYHQEKLTGPLALLLGSEDKGVARERLALCDSHIKLPMQGQVQSLNVSVAAGALLYEALRQRTSS